MTHHVKTFDEHAYEQELRRLGLVIMPVLETINLNESFDEMPVDELRDRFIAAIEKHPEIVDEGLFSKILGGAAGFVFGPRLGEFIARSLGVGKGILFDMFTSRLVSTALGAAIGDYISRGGG